MTLAHIVSQTGCVGNVSGHARAAIGLLDVFYHLPRSPQYLSHRHIFIFDD